MDGIILYYQKSCIWDMGYQVPKFIRYQNPYQLRNLKILSTFLEHKNQWAKLLEFGIFLSEKKKQGYIDITRRKINLGLLHLHT